MPKNCLENKPSFIYRDGMIPDTDYVEWLSEVKARFYKSQIKAAIRVNTSMFEFYWSIGRDLVALRAEERWGTGVVKQFALDMRHAFPDITGFSHSNVKYMKQWYSFYFNRTPKSHQAGGFLEMPATFGTVPWKHHVYIISKCHSLDEAIFYINKISEEGWSEDDNPSVGLIICKSTDRTIVEWSLKDINKPLGVATYQLQEVVDRTVAELELKAKRENDKFISHLGIESEPLI